MPLQPNWNAPNFDAIVLPQASSPGPKSRVAQEEAKIISQIEQEQLKARAREDRLFASLDDKASEKVYFDAVDKTIIIMTDQVERIAYDPLIPILSHVETRAEWKWRCIECDYINIDNNAICTSCGETTAPPPPRNNT
jgi:rubrerythrin